jgi:hypothetical protein
MASAEGQRVPELFVDDLDVVEFDRHIRARGRGGADAMRQLSYMTRRAVEHHGDTCLSVRR